MRWILLIAILLGCSGLMIDGFLAHGLKNFLKDNYTELAQNSLNTAARYQLLFSIFLIVSVSLYNFNSSKWIIASQISCILGMVLFCFSIYLKHLLGIAAAGAFAPLGGISLMISFLFLLGLLGA